ncbi:MAG: ABC transporter ATP-binding protein [Sandaracinus sp.]|nr:ABC transporter ATP-binding protein [Sandaracinus sp.]|tara:strand:- start:2678 stop:3454 length:777 start_codon:yes stop_codon:yes gene_type:complete
MALIEIRGLKKAFDGVQVLDGLDLDIHEGEVITIIGSSGSGKSVLLKMIIGLIAPDEGSIKFDGIELTELTEREWVPIRRRIGMLFQEGALFDSMTVYENVAYGLVEQGKTSEAEMRRRVAEALTAVSLPGIEERQPKQLSGGMQKRVALARAVAMEPQVVIYDEPTEGLDPINVTRVDRLILSLRDRLGITSIIVTHNMRSTFRISDRVAFIHEGKVAIVGPPDEVQAWDDPSIEHFVARAKMKLPSEKSIPPPPAD